MNFMDRKLGVCSGIIAALCLVMVSGCEDPEARSAAAEASKEAREIKGKLEAALAENKELASKISKLNEEVSKQVSERMDKLNEQVTKLGSDLQEKASASSKQILENAKTIVETSRGEYGKELESSRATIATDIQKMRDEVKATSEDLKKFMDNQLRELYPYAYQPKRMDPVTPPAPENK